MLLSNTAFSAIVVDLSQGREITMNALVMPGVSETIQIIKMAPKSAAYCAVTTVGAPLVFSAAPAKAFPADGTTNLVVNKQSDYQTIINITTNHSALAMSSSQGVYNVQSIKAALAPNATNAPLEVKILCKYISIDASTPEGMKPTKEKVDLTTKEDPQLNRDIEEFKKETITASTLTIDQSSLANARSSNLAKFLKLQELKSKGTQLLARAIGTKAHQELQSLVKHIEELLDEANRQGMAIDEKIRKEEQAALEAKKETFIRTHLQPLEQAILRHAETISDTIEIIEPNGAINQAFNDALQALLKMDFNQVGQEADSLELDIRPLEDAHKQAIKEAKTKLKADGAKLTAHHKGGMETIWALHDGNRKPAVKDLPAKGINNKTEAQQKLMDPISPHFSALHNLKSMYETLTIDTPSDLEEIVQQGIDYLTYFNQTLLNDLPN